MSYSALLDSLSVITEQWPILFGILVLILLSQALISLILRQIFGGQFTSNEYLALGLAGWILPASLLSILWMFLGSSSAGRFSLLFIVLVILGVLFFIRLRTDPEAGSQPIRLFLVLFLSISILLRLAFVSKAILPSYFDSAQHYLLIKYIVKQGPAALFTMQASYYHMGFHMLSAFLVLALHADIAQTMLILGQVILAAMPISIFFPVSYMTKSNWAGIFSMLISAWGWYMPAHAVDWGKYPALMSIALIPFVLSLAYLFVEQQAALSARRRWILGSLLAIGLFITVITHSRSLFIFGIVGLAWMTTVWWQKRPRWQRAIIFFIIIIAITLEVIFIQHESVLGLLFDPYIHKGLLVTTLVLFLSIFALKVHPQLTFAAILAICFLLASLFIPIPVSIPGHNHLTLLDRPFVEMFLYLPMSFLGGLGLAGMENFLGQGRIKLFYRNGIVSVLVSGLILLNAFLTYDLYPSNCCVIAGNNDVAAITRMDAQLPLNARIGIATTELNVTASETFEGIVGSDAGIWITPLINRATIPLPYELDFDQTTTLNMLCQFSVSHLYVGELGNTFNAAQLDGHPEWYRSLSAMPKVKVYQVVGCH
jgi:hypothetical protein